MTLAASQLQTLHRINRQKTDIQDQLQRGPKLVAAAELMLKRASDHVQATKERLTKARIDADAKQLQLREREAKIHSWQGKMNAAKENREYQALKDQIAADTQANLVLSDEILEILESIDSIGQQLKQAEAEILVRQAELEAVRGQVQQRAGVLEAELARVEAELVEAETHLTGDFRRDYLRLVSVKGEDAMAQLEENCCGGCYQSLTPMLLDRLSMQQAVVCPNCGRLVYKNQDR